MSKLSDFVSSRLVSQTENPIFKQLLPQGKMVIDFDSKKVKIYTLEQNIYVGYISYTQEALCKPIKFHLSKSLLNSIGNFPESDSDDRLDSVANIFHAMRSVVSKFNLYRYLAVEEFLYPEFNSADNMHLIDEYIESGTVDTSYYHNSGVLFRNKNILACVEYDSTTDHFYTIKPIVKDWSSFPDVISDLNKVNKKLSDLNYCLHHMSTN